MTYLEAVTLGIVQGLGEFLPISSSAHLVIVPWVFDFKDPGLTFDVALHLGTLFAIILYFWKDWTKIIAGFFQESFHFPGHQSSQNRRLFIFLVIATIPGAVAGYFLNDLAEKSLRHPVLVAVNMSVLGVFLLVADRFGRNERNVQQLTLADSIIIGLSQALALVPGVSRSGITMTSGLFMGLSRVGCARFSFLMAAPITLGACIFKIPSLFEGGISGPVVLGVVVSTVSGFLSIKYLLRYIQFHSYRVFVYYRFAFTVVVIGYYLFGSRFHP